MLLDPILKELFKMLQETNKIDFVTLTKDKEHIRLSFSDALNWDDEYEHLSLLQKKINTYFAYIEGGQLYREYPNAEGKGIIIHVMSKYKIPEIGIEFFEKVKKVANEAGYEFIYEIMSF